jgi:hypothetical protein
MVRRVTLRSVQMLAVAAVLLTGGMPAGVAMAAASPPTSYCFTRELDDGRPRRSCIRLGSYGADVCAAIERDALAAGLPPGYFARLIWQESHFDANAVSWAGAEGIAQFMPETGRLQGLGNPYNPAEALWRSAHYLAQLRSRFGNLGLAAAAYNGGENRVGRFIAGTGYLAAETLDYVQIVTGVPVTDWLAGTRARRITHCRTTSRSTRRVRSWRRPAGRNGSRRRPRSCSRGASRSPNSSRRRRRGGHSHASRSSIPGCSAARS